MTWSLNRIFAAVKSLNNFCSLNTLLTSSDLSLALIENACPNGSKHEQYFRDAVSYFPGTPIHHELL